MGEVAELVASLSLSIFFLLFLFASPGCCAQVAAEAEAEASRDSGGSQFSHKGDLLSFRNFGAARWKGGGEGGSGGGSVRDGK